jgi:hypothetical protein
MLLIICRPLLSALQRCSFCALRLLSSTFDRCPPLSKSWTPPSASFILHCFALCFPYYMPCSLCDEFFLTLHVHVLYL